MNNTLPHFVVLPCGTVVVRQHKRFNFGMGVEYSAWEHNPSGSGYKDNRDVFGVNYSRLGSEIDLSGAESEERRNEVARMIKEAYPHVADIYTSVMDKGRLITTEKDGEVPLTPNENAVDCGGAELEASNSIDPNAVVKIIRKALRLRSGKAWSVTRGSGTAYGWIRISAPPARLVNDRMTEEDKKELAALLGRDSIHCQSESIPSGYDYYREYLARAEGRVPTVNGTPYWD